MNEFRTKLKLSEIHLDGLLGKLVCVYHQHKKDLPEPVIGFFAGHDDKSIYLSCEEVGRPVTERGFWKRLMSFDIDDIPKKEIADLVVYPWATRYRIEKED